MITHIKLYHKCAKFNAQIVDQRSSNTTNQRSLKAYFAMCESGAFSINYMGVDELSQKIPDITAWVYIITNFRKTVLYTGSTINLPQRLFEHYINQGLTNSFTSKYKAFYCIYYETFCIEEDARKREQEIKLLNREKKEALINSENPDWNFLNEIICGQWPPVGLKNRNQFWR